MKLLVCVSKTPETTAKISFSADNTAFNTDGVQYIMNPYDEWYALVRALELKEQLGAGSITIINVGPPTNDPVIRKGLAIGADDAVRVNADPQSAMFVAKQIAAYAKEQSYDMVFFGKETIDYNGAEVGAMVAELLDMPYISFATNMSKGLAEQRIPNMRGIMMAKRKPLNVVEPVDCADPAKVVGYELPGEKSEVKMVDPENMEELIRLLHEEAKVI